MTTSSRNRGSTVAKKEQKRNTTDTPTGDEKGVPYDHDLVSNRVTKAQIMLTMLTLYLLLDYLYLKEQLFWISIEHSKIMREQYPSKLLDIICQLTSEFGDKYGIGIVILLAVNVLDLPKSFICSLVTATGQAMISLLKSINNEARPFFVAEIKPYKCRLEHGNPSGHALIVVALYASFCELMIRQYQISKKSQTLIWGVYFLFISFIGFGRIYNGVHTYNQVINGYAWGLVIYYTYVHIFYYEICRFISKVHQKTISELLWNTFTQGFLISYIFAIFLYFYGSTHHPTPQIWIDNIMKNCQNVDLNADPELQNFEKYNISFSLMGALLGIAIEQKTLSTNIYHNFYKTPVSQTIQRVILGIICGAPVMLPYLVSKHNPFWIVLLCRSIMPTFFGGAYAYSYQKLIAHKYGLLNTEVVNKSILHMEYETPGGDDDKKKSK